MHAFVLFSTDHSDHRISTLTSLYMVGQKFTSSFGPFCTILNRCSLTRGTIEMFAADCSSYTACARRMCSCFSVFTYVHSCCMAVMAPPAVTCIYQGADPSRAFIWPLLSLHQVAFHPSVRGVCAGSMKFSALNTCIAGSLGGSSCRASVVRSHDVERSRFPAAQTQNIQCKYKYQVPRLYEAL